MGSPSPEPLRCQFLKCIGVGFAGANADRVVDAEDKDLAVADMPGLRGRDDGLDGAFEHLARHRHLDLDLGQEGHRIFGAAIELRVALLAPISLHFGSRHSLHADRVESIADIFELEGFDDGDDDLHGRIQLLTSWPSPATGTFLMRAVASNFGIKARASWPYGGQVFAN